MSIGRYIHGPNSAHLSSVTDESSELSDDQESCERGPRLSDRHQPRRSNFIGFWYSIYVIEKLRSENKHGVAKENKKQSTGWKEGGSNSLDDSTHAKLEVLLTVAMHEVLLHSTRFGSTWVV